MSAPAHAEADWFASLYTGEGIELRADERVFALYALFNAMGYDQAPMVRQEPLPKYQLHPARQQVRQKLLSIDPELRKQADAFFDAHPQPRRRYLEYVVQAGPPPFTAAAKGKDVADLKGLEGLLGKLYGAAKLDEAMAAVQSEYRKALKGYQASIDAPIAKAKKLLKVPASAPEALLVMNLLDAQGEVVGVRGEGEVVVVVGPSEKPNVEGVVREYVRAYLEPQLEKRLGAWKGEGTLREAQALGASERTAGDYALSLFARAAALRALDANDAAYDAQAAQGYFGLREIAKGFEGGKPVEAWALEALAQVDSKKGAKR